MASGSMLGTELIYKPIWTQRWDHKVACDTLLTLVKWLFSTENQHLYLETSSTIINTIKLRKLVIFKIHVFLILIKSPKCIALIILNNFKFS